MTSIDKPSRIDPTQSRATKTRLKATTAVKPLQPAAHSKSSTRKAHSKRPAKRSARSSSKVDKVLSLLKRPGGVTLAALMKATEWQAHSVRGLLSGTISKRMGNKITSVRSDAGERVYSVSA